VLKVLNVRKAAEGAGAGGAGVPVVRRSASISTSSTRTSGTVGTSTCATFGTSTRGTFGTSTFGTLAPSAPSARYRCQ
jgi:hypothetical protein